jgi:vacuolar-type H+-ATPase subunit C/Vma6
MPVLAVQKPQDAGERAYAYAKACGNIGKSFVGKRISELGKLNTLTELDRLVFPQSQRELPGRELLNDLEKRILKRTVQHILAVVNSFSNPPPLLVSQIRVWEYDDLKTCLHHIAAGKPIPSPLSDIGRFKTVNFKAYPDLNAMLRGTEFEFVLGRDIGNIQKTNYDMTALETELDLRYYDMLLKSLKYLSSLDRFYVQRILAEEISLRNCVWALRLRSYFNKKPKEILKFLMDPTIQKDNISLSKEAGELLRFSMDTRSDWAGWRWEKFLNPEHAGEHWVVNPRFFQNAASHYIYHLSLRCFRRGRFSISAIFCYIKLKQFEEDLLTSITEGLGLEINSNEVFHLLEVPV